MWLLNMIKFKKINTCTTRHLSNSQTSKIEATKTREITVRTKQIVLFALREDSVEIKQEPIIIQIRFKITL